MVKTVLFSYHFGTATNALAPENTLTCRATYYMVGATVEAMAAGWEVARVVGSALVAVARRSRCSNHKATGSRTEAAIPRG